MYSTSGTQSLNVINDEFPSGGGLSMVVVANTRMNEARDAEDDGAPVAPNVPNYALPAGGDLSMGVFVHARMN